MKTLSAFERALVNSVLAEYGDIPAEELIQAELPDKFIQKSKTQKTRKRMLIAAIIVLIAATLAVSAIAISNPDSQLGKALGDIISDIRGARSGADVIAEVGGTKITRSELEVYKASLYYTGTGYSDEGILQKLIVTTLLFEEAQSRGITVSEKEIDDAIRLAREGLADPEQKQTHDILAGYIEGLGISEDEYWDMIRPTYNKSLTIAKLKNAMLDDLSAENNSDTVSKDEFDAYFADFVKRLVARANITD